MSLVPGMGIVRGMGLTLKRFFQPKATIRYPEVRADVAPKFRGRLQLLYDEYGTLKCETCFQCAQACPIECIDMGGIDTKGRFHVHWGAPETYGERREESAIRRSGRPVADTVFRRFDPVDTRALDDILERHDYDPKHLLTILEETQAEYGFLPVGALKHISRITGAWYAIDLRDGDLLPPPPVRAAGDHVRARRGRGARRDRARLSLRAGRVARVRGARQLMAQFLKTPKEWPAVLTGRAAALAADPSDLDAAIRAGAFDGLRKAVRDLGPTGTIATIASSGLRGRGGGGFPTGEKWRAATNEPATQRYVVANGYGADPSVRTDATLVAADPWSLIEGLAIAAFAIGATEAIIADPRRGHGARHAARGRDPRGGGGGLPGRGRPRLGLPDHDDRPARAGRVHAGRGDGPAQGARGQARPARAAAAVPGRSVACSASPPSSTTSRPWPPSRGSSARARRRSRRSAPRPARARSSSSSAGRRAAGSPRCRWGRSSGSWSSSPAAAGRAA